MAIDTKFEQQNKKNETVLFTFCLKYHYQNITFTSVSEVHVKYFVMLSPITESGLAIIIKTISTPDPDMCITVSAKVCWCIIRITTSKMTNFTLFSADFYFAHI